MRKLQQIAKFSTKFVMLYLVVWILKRTRKRAAIRQLTYLGSEGEEKWRELRLDWIFFLKKAALTVLSVAYFYFLKSKYEAQEGKTGHLIREFRQSAANIFVVETELFYVQAT